MGPKYPLPGAIQHTAEPISNQFRLKSHCVEPRCLRTYTPTQVVIARSAGIFHWTPENRRLYDFTSGVLVANLGHNPTKWMQRFSDLMGWPAAGFGSIGTENYMPAMALTAYNAITPLEVEASNRLVRHLQASPGGTRLQQVLWAASGSEAVQKAIWAALARDRTRPMILATRFGFHGKKGLANAVTGSELDPERDPRVRFVSFPMRECIDISLRDEPFDVRVYQEELHSLLRQFGRRIGALITEPYLGGGGSFHPPRAYLKLLEQFCRDEDIVFILDEVQSNFGRTGRLFAFERYGVEPDIVVLVKGLGNGIPVAAAVGRTDLLSAMDYGEGSDTWSANPLCCAAVIATLEEFERHDLLQDMQPASAVIEQGLVSLKSYPFVAHIRGEKDGMVWGVEMTDHSGKSASAWAKDFVLACYRGDAENNDGVHLLGPLSGKVVRIAPPLVINVDEAAAAINIMHRAAQQLLSTSTL
jgi:4-aminobutyrate aminotransferase-like enzyme